jgi:hypothetical protein
MQRLLSPFYKPKHDVVQDILINFNFNMLKC